MTDAAYHELNFTSAADLQGTLDALVQQADLHTLVDAQGRAWGVEVTSRLTRECNSDTSVSADPSPAEFAQEIERLAEQAGASEELFSDAVHDVFSQQGSAVNNEGFYEQALVLLRERAFGDLQKTSAVLRTMIAQDRAGEPAAHCSDCGALLARPSAEHYQVTCPDCGAENSA